MMNLMQIVDPAAPSFQFSQDELIQKIIWSIAILLIVWALVLVINKVLYQKVKTQRGRHKTRKFSYYGGSVVTLLGLFFLWSGTGAEIALTISVIGAGLAFALQQPVTSLAGWLYIITNRPYDVGDRIEVGDVSGDVIDIRLFKTVLLESSLEGLGGGTQNTGRIADFPNSNVFGLNIFNYSRGFEYVWNEYPILVTFESNWQKAHDELTDIVNKETSQFESPASAQINRMMRSYMMQDEKLSSKVYVMIKDSGVELGLRYLTPIRQRRVIRDSISRQVMELFEREPDLEFAYPTYRIFRREIEEAKIELLRKQNEANTQE